MRQHVRQHIHLASIKRSRLIKVEDKLLISKSLVGAFLDVQSECKQGGGYNWSCNSNTAAPSKHVDWWGNQKPSLVWTINGDVYGLNTAIVKLALSKAVPGLSTRNAAATITCVYSYYWLEGIVNHSGHLTINPHCMYQADGFFFF